MTKRILAEGVLVSALGARASMPGMMDTILNPGLNEETVRGLIAMTDNPRFGWDSYRRFIQMYGDVVLEVPHADFEKILEGVKHEPGVKLDTELSADDLQRITKMYKERVLERTGKPFPSDPEAQLWAAIESVFASWYNDRAVSYRRLNRIPHDWGTAANVQAMVFGNMGEDSATGVAFTRDPSSGENHFYGEYLTNAQGEDVVAGIRTPHPLTVVQKHEEGTVKRFWICGDDRQSGRGKGDQGIGWHPSQGQRNKGQ